LVKAFLGLFSNDKEVTKKDAVLERRFQTVKLEAPTIEQAVQILKGLRPT